jgi:hypothetical protein
VRGLAREVELVEDPSRAEVGIIQVDHAKVISDSVVC